MLKDFVRHRKQWSHLRQKKKRELTVAFLSRTDTRTASIASSWNID